MAIPTPTPATDTNAPHAPRAGDQRLVTLNQVQLCVETSGSGQPLVLVHGSWDDRQVWTQVRQHLAQRFRVVGYDRRGHTDSQDGTNPGTRRDDEDDLAALIHTLGLAPANVVGASFGASVALGLAARRPDLFRTLCVHEPPLLTLVTDDPMVPEVGQLLDAVATRIRRGEPEAAARDFMEQIGSGPGSWATMSQRERAAMVANAHTFAGEQLDPGWASVDLDALQAVTFPVLLTRGDQGPPFFSTIVARLAETIHRADLRTLPGAAHEPNLTHPADYASLISRFVAADQ